MFFNKKHPWRFTIGAWGAFIVVTIFFLIFDYNIYTIFGFLTAAIIITIGNIIYYFTKNLVNKTGKRGSESMNVNLLSKDKTLTRQVLSNQEDRENGRIYNKEQGLKYLQHKIKKCTNIDFVI